MALVGFGRVFQTANPFRLSNGGLRRGFHTYGESQLCLHTMSPIPASIQQNPAGPSVGMPQADFIRWAPAGPSDSGHRPDPHAVDPVWLQNGGPVRDFIRKVPPGPSYRGPDTGQTLNWWAPVELSHGRTRVIARVFKRLALKRLGPGPGVDL